jgi:hypothetical protein
MEVGELVGAFDVSVNKEDFCDDNPVSNGWKSRINQWGSEKNCDPDRLYRWMKKDKDKDQGYLSGPQPFVAKPDKVGYEWQLDNCKSDHFPLQAHHIIPKNHLPSHGVCAFLAKGYTKNLKYNLIEDTFYDTDHANNGYCMPYATPLDKWKIAKNDNDKMAIAFDLMDNTERQLHQGSHKAGPYADPTNAEEESGLHEDGPGYLDKINDLLDIVQSAATTHACRCRICKPNESKKEIHPREATVRHIDQVSGIIKLLIDANRIFISKLSSWHWGANKIPIVKPDWLK